MIEKWADAPRYVSHKRVIALEIAGVSGHDVRFKDSRFPPIHCDSKMFARFMPSEGDFYVIYADDYASFSPRKAFLEGYTPEGQSFADIKRGLKIASRPHDTAAGTNIGDGVALTSASHPGWPEGEDNGQ